ncbi:MAG: hypothetical protein Fur0041_19650 [Bacteroidia bacterium]
MLEQRGNVMKGYKAASFMISTKFFINPFNSIYTFNIGKADLEDLISENYDQTELHFIRYTIQMNSPRFIRYYGNIEEDRHLLRKFISKNRDSELAAHMKVFIADTKDPLLACY